MSTFHLVPLGALSFENNEHHHHYYSQNKSTIIAVPTYWECTMPQK